MRLEIDGVRVPIAQLGPDFVILTEPASSAVRRGEIALQVDSTEERWTVELPDGLARPGERTRIVNLS